MNSYKKPYYSEKEVRFALKQIYIHGPKDISYYLLAHMILVRGDKLEDLIALRVSDVSEYLKRNNTYLGQLIKNQIKDREPGDFFLGDPKTGLVSETVCVTFSRISKKCNLDISYRSFYKTYLFDKLLEVQSPICMPIATLRYPGRLCDYMGITKEEYRAILSGTSNYKPFLHNMFWADLGNDVANLIRYLEEYQRRTDSYTGDILTLQECVRELSALFNSYYKH